MSTSLLNRSRARASTKSTRSPERFITSDSNTWHLATEQQLRSLSAETLRLHLSEKSLVTTGNKSVMAQQLYDYFHSTATQSIATSVPVTLNTSSVPLNTFPILSPATTTTNVNTQATSSVAAQVKSSNIQPQSQTQHLANLLYQAALQLTPSCPTFSQPQIISPAMSANAYVSVSEPPHRPNDSLYPPRLSQQEDQLSKASAPTPSNQPPGTLLLANKNPVKLDTVSAAASSPV